MLVMQAAHGAHGGRRGKALAAHCVARCWNTGLKSLHISACASLGTCSGLECSSWLIMKLIKQAEPWFGITPSQAALKSNYGKLLQFRSNWRNVTWL